MKPKSINKGALGEQLVSESLARLPASYRTFNNLILPVFNDPRHTTQIDHVVTCAAGIIVIETKKFEGTIAGREQDQRWLQVLGSHRFAFANPLRQNEHHVAVLGRHLGLTRSYFHSVVVFVGLATLAPGMPSNVISTIAVGLANLRRFIESFVEPMWSPQHLDAINSRLVELTQSGLTLDDHERSIRSRDLERRVRHMLDLTKSKPCSGRAGARVQAVRLVDQDFINSVSSEAWLLKSIRAQLSRRKSW